MGNSDGIKGSSFDFNGYSCNVHPLGWNDEVIMLSNKELVDAITTNLENWDWSINSKFSLNEEEGKALLELLQIRKMQQTYERLRGML